MSTLKVVLHGQKTLKTTILKNLSKPQKFARKISAAEFRFSQTLFFAVQLNVTYDSEAYNLMKLYLETSHSESGRTTVMEPFCGNDQRVKAVDYFCKRAPSWMFDWILNATLPNNVL